jgi:hypothetical protein
VANPTSRDSGPTCIVRPATLGVQRASVRRLALNRSKHRGTSTALANSILSLMTQIDGLEHHEGNLADEPSTDIFLRTL